MTLFAKDNGFTLCSADDALTVIFSGQPGCIFTADDLHEDFYNLSSGLAGELLQKFTNYQYKVAFILPADHQFGMRVTELARDHQGHRWVQFFHQADAAQRWLQTND